MQHYPAVDLMPLYDLPIWAGDSNPFPKKGYQGAGWKLIAHEIPNIKHGSKSWWRHFLKMREKYRDYSVHTVSNGDHAWIAPQIIADAKSRLDAQRVFELLTSSLTILDGNTLFELHDGLAVPHDRSNLEDLDPDDLASQGHTFSRDNVRLGCQLAAKLSKRKATTYSAFKLTLSYKLASAHWMHFHPRYNPKSFSVSQSQSQHVRMASAITLAYSAIEELQLEPRAFRSKQIKTETGWDETAQNDLHKRLKLSGIDISSPINWTRRGTQTRIHKYKRAADGAMQRWAKGIVRDKAVAIEDALIESSWLRSKCTTHKYQKATSSITIYDVTNVQFLARRLLLEKSGLWPHLLPVTKNP